jgi:hypothetical protein
LHSTLGLDPLRLQTVPDTEKGDLLNEPKGEISICKKKSFRIEPGQECVLREQLAMVPVSRQKPTTIPPQTTYDMYVYRCFFF